MTNVLLIEDDDDTVEEISGYLSHRGYTIERVADGEAGLAGAFQGSAEVLIVDRMLPLLDGLTVLIRLRQDRIRAPAIVLSALAGVDERVDGLRAGGDDYLVKPFVLAELEALVRRRDIGQETMLRVGPLHLDLVKRTARRGGREIEMLPREFMLLEYMMRRAERTVTRSMLFEDVWNYRFTPAPHPRRRPDGASAPQAHRAGGGGVVEQCSRHRFRARSAVLMPWCSLPRTTAFLRPAKHRPHSGRGGLAGE